jgi:uncharacterized repeat protein (TIGR01451 family)
MRIARLTAAVATVLVVLVVNAGSASAASVPGFTIESFALPTNFSAAHTAGCNNERQYEHCDAYEVKVTNAGSRATDGSAITLTDSLPAGLTVQRVALYASGFQGGGFDLGQLLCGTAPVQCEYPGPFGEVLPPLAPDETLNMIVYVATDPSLSGTLTNTARASGGGAPEASVSNKNAVGGELASFGLSNFDFYISGLDGMPDSQAGDHPYEVTTTIGLNNGFRVNNPAGSEISDSTSVQDVKDFVTDVPLGLIGSTLAAPRCTLAQLSAEEGRCPADTIVGHLRTEPEELTSINSPIWNLVPEKGVAAEFGYVDALHGAHIFYVRVVPTPAGYLLQATNPDIPAINLARITVTFYGNPAAKDGTGNAQVPMFTNPTACSAGPLVATIHMDSWQNPGRFNADGTPDFNDPKWASSESVSPPVTGCNGVQFTPELGAQPTTHMADTPSGLDFELKLAQTETMGTLATPPLKKAVVTLPAGFTIDPSAGDGLGACSEAQIGWVGPSTMNFNPSRPECPEASKIGSLELTTPLLPSLLTGALYLARQEENPFKTLLAAYVVVEDPVTGVLVKIAGKFLPDPKTGRLTAVFDENPQVPFDDLKLHFFGGPRAELATPQSCGTFTTTSELTPWSAPDSGPVATPFDDFVINEDCSVGFAPSFTAGSLNLQAGAYTPFVASFSRSDTDQELGGLTLSLPPGLLANLTGVPLCSDAQVHQAETGTGGCPAASQVGSVVTGVGPGPNPLFVAGKMYLTGPYNGGPYGLAVVVPAVAGPFDFGTVVVRQSLRIDPTDSHVTDVSDPFPTIIDGIPLRLRRVDVRLERPGFTFNPTNCDKLGFGGGLSSTQGATSGVSASFQVTNCATLGFKPVFKVSTSGKTSRANGASLSVKLSYPKAPFGSQANIKSVKVDLPKQLPSRLSTLQKSCADSVFEENPAACPASSRVGNATATTPILEATLSGPAYFVSHGGQKFPELIIVLSGQGITVDLRGETFISKAGITSSTFHTVPDVPIGVFTLNLPEESNSALAAPKSLCTGSLKMPTAFTAQNGATIKQATPITVSGCPKRKPAKQAKKAKRATRAHQVRRSKGA